MEDVGKLSKYYMQMTQFWYLKKENISTIVTEFEKACDGMGLKINVEKSKVLTIKKDQTESCEKLRVNGEEMQEMDKFKYL